MNPLVINENKIVFLPLTFNTCYYRPANPIVRIRAKRAAKKCTATQMPIVCLYQRQVTSSANVNQDTTVLERSVRTFAWVIATTRVYV